jgi:hypothetical protein
MSPRVGFIEREGGRGADGFKAFKGGALTRRNRKKLREESEVRALVLLDGRLEGGGERWARDGERGAMAGDAAVASRGGERGCRW